MGFVFQKGFFMTKNYIIERTEYLKREIEKHLINCKITKVQLTNGIVTVYAESTVTPVAVSCSVYDHLLEGSEIYIFATHLSYELGALTYQAE